MLNFKNIDEIYILDLCTLYTDFWPVQLVLLFLYSVFLDTD